MKPLHRRPARRYPPRSETGKLGTGGKVPAYCVRVSRPQPRCANLWRFSRSFSYVADVRAAVPTLFLNIPKAAAWAALGFLYNTGQDCTAGSRLFVQDTIYDKFIEVRLSVTRYVPTATWLI